jgi:hypothetical protein
LRIQVLPDAWNPQSSTSPLSTRAFDLYKIEVNGTFDGVDFQAGDFLLSKQATTTVQDLTDFWPIRQRTVNSVNGKTGNVVLDYSDISGTPAELAASIVSTFSYHQSAVGTTYLGGFYEFADTEASLVEAGTVTIGSATVAYGAKAFAVLGAWSTVGTEITLTVSGTSIDDTGTLTPADSEQLYSGAPGGRVANDYMETTKRWVGTVTYTLTSNGASSSATFNYGLVKADNFANGTTVIDMLDVTGLGGAADAGFDMELIRHTTTGWTFAASGFVPGESVASYATDLTGFSDIETDEPISWKRTGTVTTLAPGDGFMLKVTTGVVDAVKYLTANVRQATP